MEKIEPRTLSGFMELLPNEQILFNQMKEKIQKTYEKFGFLPFKNRRLLWKLELNRSILMLRSN